MSIFVRPAVENLVFQVYGRALHPELFEVVAQRTVRRDDYELQVGITATGHVLRWSSGKTILTEVAAGPDPPLPERGRLLDCRLRSELTRAVDCGLGIRYEMSFQVEVLAPEIFHQVHEEIVADGARRGLLHHFPSSSRLSVAPLGFLQADGRRGCLCLSSFHTFPSEYTVVKTQSLIERHE
jgi:hypothetical protein